MVHSECVPMVVLGGGGHTQEMVEIVKAGPCFSHVSIVVSSCDQLSSKIFIQGVRPKIHYLYTVDRPNDINKAYSLLQMMWSMILSIIVVFRSKSDFLLCNGPGMCVPVALAYRLINPFKPVFYIESITRVKSISTTGRILQYIASVFIVQSKLLENTKYPKRIYQKIFEIKKIDKTKE